MVLATGGSSANFVMVATQGRRASSPEPALGTRGAPRARDCHLHARNVRLKRSTGALSSLHRGGARPGVATHRRASQNSRKSPTGAARCSCRVSRTIGHAFAHAEKDDGAVKGERGTAGMRNSGGRPSKPEKGRRGEEHMQHPRRDQLLELRVGSALDRRHPRGLSSQPDPGCANRNRRRQCPSPAHCPFRAYLVCPRISVQVREPACALPQPAHLIG